MKKLCILICSVFMASCYNQERNCTDFKTGTFLFEQEINGEKHTSTFVRTDMYEIETYNGRTDTASIRWVNDCEYVLQKINPKNMSEQKAVQMKILTTTANGYTFEYSIVGDVNKQKGTITKIQQ
ncbi:DNA topoisomerase IV [Flavobacterium sp. CBA20B-1]|uniref:DNA topoisomerase IV n=1 Tax=unclassified Flavobacterium TaxID=196869 RepID=UPI0022247D6D|nr:MULTISPECIES: DNA topoisomerase IV [unclassified Flavobacterium]WCM42931.1 DNA topoisomerase IV [Flavobacterium sp. CBA20B-1]